MKKQTATHSIQSAFVLLLMGLFAVLSVVLVLLGTQAYQSQVARSRENNQLRIAQNYVRGVVRSEQTQDAIQVETLEGIPVLSICYTDTEEDPEEESESYYRRLYCSDGYLMESYVSSSQAFRATDGEPICEMSAFRPEISENMLVISLENTSGEESTLRLALRCGASAQ